MRTAKIERKTKETDIKVYLKIDGKGNYDIKTAIPFLDHMLSLFSRHGLFDLRLRAKGDTEVDYHHTVEDIGIILGNAIKKALGDKKGIKRYGEASIPMDETLATVSIDISGRPYLIYNVKLPKKAKLKEFDPDLVEDFFRSIVNHSGITLHINLIYGRDTHHILEAVFKAFGRSLDQATKIDPRIKGIPSTKGRL
ncbi:MAG: imidazoleglycerol-phosphate dehydratase HisB [Nitrospirae bacterium]|nr:imidazoleglycerol-phosphate dehydratase HisB [Nitrospirota bacterium]